MDLLQINTGSHNRNGVFQQGDFTGLRDIGRVYHNNEFVGTAGLEMGIKISRRKR